ncbi:MAG: zinc-ribbon domain-containing protein [Candidatus Lokiarchaeota archaeon]|nr:zinc-ribbon domain-containing protein [Candidatus Lokiarchaeota archaeon]
MTNFCPYCGKKARSTDKFCIYCGKPMLSGLDKPKEETKKEIKVEEEFKEEEKERPSIDEPIEEKEQIEVGEKEEVKQKKDKKAKKVKEKHKEEFKEILPLSDEIKKRLELMVDLRDIKNKKKRLAAKFDDVEKLIEDDQYEIEAEYTADVKIKLDALKKIKSDLEVKEQEIKGQISGEFEYLTYEKIIAEKKDQLNTLHTNLKLRKVDKEIYESLKLEYKKELEEAKQNLKNLQLGIKLWSARIEAEKSDLKRDLKFLKGRLSSKEIKEDEFKPKEKDLEVKIRKKDLMIETLKKYTKNR